MDKTNYVVHIKALQFYLQKGMKIKQVQSWGEVQTEMLVETLDRF